MMFLREKKSSEERHSFLVAMIVEENSVKIPDIIYPRISFSPRDSQLRTYELNFQSYAIQIHTDIYLIVPELSVKSILKYFNYSLSYSRMTGLFRLILCAYNLMCIFFFSGFGNTFFFFLP